MPVYTSVRLTPFPGNRGTSVGKGSTLLGRLWPIRAQVAGKSMRFHIQPIIQISIWYWGLLPRGQSHRCVELTTHLHLVPRLKMPGAIRALPPYAFIA